MQCWEYCVISFDISGGFFSSGGQVDAGLVQAELNKHGALGWELVSMATTQAVQGYSNTLVATFKRPQA